MQPIDPTSLKIVDMIETRTDCLRAEPNLKKILWQCMAPLWAKCDHPQVIFLSDPVLHPVPNKD